MTEQHSDKQDRTSARDQSTASPERDVWKVSDEPSSEPAGSDLLSQPVQECGEGPDEDASGEIGEPRSQPKVKQDGKRHE
jgi:hypothetical protein